MSMEITPRTGLPGNAIIRIENNLPVPVYSNKLTPASVTELFFAALSDEYRIQCDGDGTPFPHEKEFEGWTNVEVMTIRRVRAAAAGDIDSQKLVLDRTLGKPVQPIEQKTENVTLSKALERIGSRLRERRPEVYQMLEDKRQGSLDVIDVTPKEYQQTRRSIRDL